MERETEDARSQRQKESQWTENWWKRRGLSLVVGSLVVRELARNHLKSPRCTEYSVHCTKSVSGPSKNFESETSKP